MSAIIDRHIEDISRGLRALADATERIATALGTFDSITDTSSTHTLTANGAWLRLPNGDALNMAHAARIVDAGDVPHPMIIICWAVANCQPDDDRTLPETHVHNADALAVRAWLDRECAP